MNVAKGILSGSDIREGIFIVRLEDFDRKNSKGGTPELSL
jgi:hypothetical protein